MYYTDVLDMAKRLWELSGVAYEQWASLEEAEIILRNEKGREFTKKIRPGMKSPDDLEIISRNEKSRELTKTIRAEMESPDNLELETRSKKLIEDALSQGENLTDMLPFKDILVSLKLPLSLMKPGKGIGQDDRAIVGIGSLKAMEGDCVIYGAGIDYQNGYEVSMANETGCDVHAFDCTMTDEKKLFKYLHQQHDVHNLEFHPWCIGENTDVVNFDRPHKYDMKSDKHLYHTIDEIMLFLRHSHLDLLKFDIEGFEWQLFDSLLKSSKRNLPQQLAFELHTEGASDSYVPPDIVRNKTRKDVVKLFAELRKLGYRVVSKEVNRGDRSCCEFVLYRVFDDI